MKKLLAETAERATRYVTQIHSRSVVPRPEDLARLEALGGPLPEAPSDPAETLARLDDVGSPATTDREVPLLAKDARNEAPHEPRPL